MTKKNANLEELYSKDSYQDFMQGQLDTIIERFWKVDYYLKNYETLGKMEGFPFENKEALITEKMQLFEQIFTLKEEIDRVKNKK